MKRYDDRILAEEYKKYGNCRSVAEIYHCSDETVRRALIKYDVPRVIHKYKKPVRKRKPDEKEIDDILTAYYETNKNINDIAKEFHRAQYIISEIIKTKGHGIKYCEQNSKKVTDDLLIQEVRILTRQQIADKYGMNIASVDRRINKLKISAVKAERVLETNADTWHLLQSSDDFVKKYLENDFEFVAFKRRKYRIKCNKCGDIFERDRSSIRRKNVICYKCKEIEKQEIVLQNERIKLVRSFYAILESKMPKKCECCGNTFYSQYKDQKYCSKHCKNKRNRRSNTSIKRRCKKYGVYYDPKVKSEEVFKRDGYRCMICGLACNKEDNTWSEWMGPYSPTVDHIIALANGGTHTWDNVQCAHAICNSYKRDLFTV